MSVLQTSLNVPLPATNGQLLIGNTGSLPTVSTLTGGTNIGITNGAGTITVGAIGAANITWQNSSPTLMAAFNGYVNNASTGNYTLPTSPNVGDTYSVQSLGFIFSIVAGTNQHIVWKTVSGTTLAGSSLYGATTLICVNENPTNMQFAMLGKNNGTFTLT